MFMIIVKKISQILKFKEMGFRLILYTTLAPRKSKTDDASKNSALFAYGQSSP